MKTKLLRLLAVIPAVAMLGGCGDDEEETKEPAQSITRIADYIYEVDTYTSLDYDFADDYYYRNNYNWGGGCSAVTKMIGDHRVIGRNMDLNISENCAYVVRTEVPKKHKTMGLQYTFRDVSPKYEDVKKNGISSEWSKLLPFFQDDVMNETGFHVEINMRHAEVWPNGDDMFACWGTNPEGIRTVHMFELPIYLAQNCSTVAEARDYINTLNIYSKEGYWNYCFIIADATGDAALLEFSMNQIYWIDEAMINNGDLDYLNKGGMYPNLNYHAIAQTNFYINRLSFALQDTKSGVGRLQTLENDIDSVDSRAKMYALMDKIAYSNFYLPYEECMANHFDPRSEQVGEFTGGSYYIVMNDEWEDWVKEAMDEYSAPIRELTREQKRAANQYWESTFTEVVDCMDMTIQVRIYEDDEQMYKLTMEKTEKISAIN